MGSSSLYNILFATFAFIGIVGGNPGYYLGGGSYNFGPFNPGRETSATYRSGHGSHGGNGGYDGGYYHGY